MSETLELVRTTADRLFADLATDSARRAVETGGWSGALWQALDDNGLLDALGTEDDANAPAQWATAAVILRSAGFHAAPAPIAETMVARWLLRATGAGPIDGPTSVLPASPHARFTARRSGSRWLIDGHDAWVPWLPASRTLAVVAGSDDGPLLAWLEIPPTAVTPGRRLSGEPVGALALDGAEAAQTVALAGHSSIRTETTSRFLGIARSVMMVGAAERALEMTVRYAGERRQFGRAIGDFQAVQQNLALLASETAAAAAIVDAAVAALARTQSWSLLGDAACQRTRAAADSISRIAHQVHGAIGFTHEYALHDVTRRLWSWRDDYGAASDWAENLAATAFAAGRKRLWPKVTSASEPIE